VEEYADEVFGLLNEGAHMYFCGLKVRACDAWLCRGDSPVHHALFITLADTVFVPPAEINRA
jgi:hypothetical protein